MSGWWQTAKVGDKVVCVDSGALPDCEWGDGEAPVTGRIYTIRRIFLDSEGYLVLDFQELRRSAETLMLIGDAGYGASRFRPVQTKSTETGMAILRKLLNTQPVREDA